MTYKDLVNNVLRRLREIEVNSVQTNSYSKLIGDLVNDAKDLVENSWDWSALRTTLTITTTADVFNYSLTGSQNNIKELNVLNDTSNSVMQYQTNNWFDSQFLLSAPETGSPQYYTYNGVDSDGDTLIEHLAVALASRERGETGGTATQEYFAMANKYLSDAIAQDAGRHPEETIFYTP